MICFRFRTLIRPYYRGAAGMVLVYDVTDEKTFHNIEVGLDRPHEQGREGSLPIRKLIYESKDVLRMIAADF